MAVDDARPVAAALDVLEKRHGWLISYEDPRYVYSADMTDVTFEVRTDLSEYEPGKVPKVLGPRGGRLQFSYVTSARANGVTNPSVVIRRALQAYASAGGTIFRLRQDGKRFDVIPAQVKDQSGHLVDQIPILDTRISFLEEERNGLETLRAICRALTEASGQEVVVGTISPNLFIRHRERRGAGNEIAREVLASLLDGIDKRLVWDLFYDPTDESYALNIDYVPEPPKLPKTEADR